jgi:hypothetical protein
MIKIPSEDRKARMKKKGRLTCDMKTRRSYFVDMRNGESLFPVFIPFYLLGFIPVIVPIFSILDIYKGAGARGISSPLTKLYRIYGMKIDDYGHKSSSVASPSPMIPLSI